MIEFRPSTAQDVVRVMEIWRKAVDATHHFLAPGDRVAIEKELSVFIPKIEMMLAVDPSDRPVGFMYLHGGHLEALFVDPNQHGQGVGKALVHSALSLHPRLTTDVNEQNTQALGFYERIGFERTGRSAVDDQGRPYPLIHLRFRNVS
ncbi:acetyltransferase [Mesorhizobium xinjiangense]|uniref:acetyltransferase n=1 Tax=Mesorhizobium xinjiangense TaxID=2678685 RepID=UPI0012EEC723|nr:acetyltransferase [Mesorhizobium xinjiangense]